MKETKGSVRVLRFSDRRYARAYIIRWYSSKVSLGPPDDMRSENQIAAEDD